MAATPSGIAVADVGASAPRPARSRRHIHHPTTLGQRAADSIANGMGSWTFIIAQTVIVGMWIALNILAFVRHFDPYPFILLNLLFSTQAAYAAPMILMSQNRQAQRDRMRDDLEAHEVDALVAEMGMLKQINQRQLEILELLRETLCASGAGPADRGAAT